MIYPAMEIDGIPIPLESGGAFASYRYSVNRRSTDLLMADNSTRRQSYAGASAKLAITVSVSGMPAPSVLAGLDTTQPHQFSAGSPRSVSMAAPTTSVLLPAARRTGQGYEPVAWAILPDGRVKTAVTITGDTASVTPISGATGYIVDYYPEITAWIDYDESADAGDATYSWTLTATEA